MTVRYFGVKLDMTVRYLADMFGICVILAVSVGYPVAQPYKAARHLAVMSDMTVRYVTVMSHAAAILLMRARNNPDLSAVYPAVSQT